MSARRLGVVAIDPSSFDPAVPRDAEALAALRAAGARVLELRRPEREPAVEPVRAPRARPGLRGALYALAGAFGLLHARDLQIPALSTASLAAIAALAALAVAPALVALRAGRRLGLLALAPAALAAAWVSAGPLALARRAARRARRAARSTRRRPGCRSCCRSRASTPSCARRC